MISPTGIMEMRGQDRWGHGGFARPRGTRVHNGVDFVVRPENSLKVLFPFEEGKIVRVANPYAADKRYGGCLIEAQEDGLEYIAKMFYFAVDLDYVDTHVGLGTNIGMAQDLSLRYPGITPHIHLQVALAATPRKWFNPLALLKATGDREAH